MSKKQPAVDPQKKYWWLVFVVVPIILALIAILPALLKKESSSTQKSLSPKPTQKAGDVKQSTEHGSNFSNIQGSHITINNQQDNNDTQQK